MTMIKVQNLQIVAPDVLCIIILFFGSTGLSNIQVIPNGTDVSMVRFDATLELNAHHMETQMVIFGRYWVTEQHYILGIVWTEPHYEFGLSVYPVSMIIESGQQFRISSQLRKVPNRVFSKPIGSRGAFRHVFNSYPILDIRFAESEAFARRLYVDDLGRIPPLPQDGWHDLALAGPPSDSDALRSLKRLSWRSNNSRMTDLHVFDTHNQMVANVHYDYFNHRPHQLQKQTVVLPERHMVAELQGAGLTVKTDHKTEQHNKFNIVHHKGGRECVIDYSPFQIDDAHVSLPTAISVCRQDTGGNLRSARMENHIMGQKNPKDMRGLAKSFCHYSPDELKCRALWSKYRSKPVESIVPGDMQRLDTIRKRFAGRPTDDMTTGQLLKHINMFIQLDWVQHEVASLQEHFKQYLQVFQAAELDHMQMIGGQNLIYITAKWNQFQAAERLLGEWTKTLMSTCRPEVLTAFAEAETRKGYNWTSIRLMDSLLHTPPNDPQISFEAAFIRSMAMNNLYQNMQHPDRNDNTCTKAQIRWVSLECTLDELGRQLRRSVADSQQYAEKLARTDDRSHKVKMRWLDKIKTTLEASPASPSTAAVDVDLNCLP